MLQIQTTNRCNMNCPHCMLYEDGEKGTDYNDYITEKTIDDFFKMNIRIIHNMNFTGGEPLLNVNAIIYTLEKIMKEKIKVVGIDIATNGTILSDELIYVLNKFVKYVKDEVLTVEIEKLYEKNILEGNFLAQIRISKLYHNNDFKKAYDFYSERADELVNVEIINGETESKKVKWGLENRGTIIAYSGRAKKMDVEYFCDSPHHKIVYVDNVKDEDMKCVKCPLELNVNGDIGIACYCSLKDAHKDALGNVSDGKCLSEMITQWNYRTPLTCDEACKLAEVKMYYETKRLEDISRILKKEVNFDDLENMVAKEEVKYLYIENYRRLLHDKVPCLTSDEIEWISHFWLELETEKANNRLTDEEIRQSTEEIDNHIAKLIYEHSFDDIKKIHEEFSFLTHEECEELIKCEKICRHYRKKFPPLHVIPYWERGINLMRLNEYREKMLKAFLINGVL